MFGAKKTSGTLYVLGVGDSIGEGVGEPPAGNGDDGLKYGGAAVPAGLTLIMDGVLYNTTLPDSLGAAGANPGYWIHLALAALAGGFSAVVIIVESTSGSETASIRTNNWPEAAYEFNSRGFVPDLAVICAGTNNSQNGENAGFETAIRLLTEDLENSYKCRICYMEPVAQAAGSYPESDLVRADLQALAAGSSTRFTVSGAGQPRADDAHPSLVAYRDMGQLILPGYLAGG